MALELSTHEKKKRLCGMVDIYVENIDETN